MTYPWLQNYISFRGRYERSDEYWSAEVFFLATMARGANSLFEKEKVSGNAKTERVMRFVLRRILRMANFTMLETGSEYLKQIKRAQSRIQGIGIKCRPWPNPHAA